MKTEEVAKSSWFETLGRIGLADRGLLYVITGFLAFEVALGSDDNDVDREGALQAVARQPMGRLLLTVVALGLAAYAAWRLMQALVNVEDRSVAARLGDVGKGLLYAASTVIALQFVAGKPRDAANSKEQGLTAKIFTLPMGRWLVAALGIALVAYGGWNIYRAATGRWKKHMKAYEMSEGAERFTAVVAAGGLIARGVVFSLVGAFFVRAAWTYNSGEAVGLDGALKRVTTLAYGRPLLVLVAIGLITYGLFSFMEARYRKVLGS